MSDPANPVSQEGRDSTMDHLDEITCLMYAERQLDRARAQAVSAHAEECAACRTLLRALERESRLLTRAMLEEDEPLPARLAQFPGHSGRSFQWVWGVIFGLAATGVYALYTEFISWAGRLEQAGLGGASLLSVLIEQGAFWKGWQSVIPLLEALAVLIVAGFGLLIVRRRISRRGSALALVLTTLCVALALPAPAGATEFRHEDRITIAQDQVVHGDLYAGTGRLRVEGTVEGDVVVGAGEIEVTGHILGDLISFSPTLRVTGQIDGNIRAYSGNLSLQGKVGHNVMIFGGDLDVDRDATIGGSITSFGGRLTLDGQVQRDLVAMGGAVTLSGTLGGSATIRTAELNINRDAVVKGSIDYHGDNPPEVASGAQLASPVHFEKLKHGDDYRSGRFYMWRVIWAAAYILFGLALFKMMPDFSLECVDGVERYGPAVGLGILVGAGVFVGGIIACVTVVGLFIGVCALFLWLAGMYYAQVIVAALVGQWLLGHTRESWPLVGRMALGMVVIRLCFAVPYAGVWIKFAVIVWGLGAISLALYSRWQSKIPTIHTGAMQPVPVAAGPAL